MRTARMAIPVVVVVSIVAFCVFADKKKSKVEFREVESELARALEADFTAIETSHFRIETYHKKKQMGEMAELCEGTYSFAEEIFKYDEEETKPGAGGEGEFSEPQGASLFWDGLCKVSLMKTKRTLEKYVDYIVKQKPELEEWGKQSKESEGFYLYDPLVTCNCVEVHLEGEEGSRHGTVHDIAHFLIFYVFSQQEVPIWLNEGFALYMEGEAILKGVKTRCVAGTGGADDSRWVDGRNWVSQMANLVKDREDPKLTSIIDIAGWSAVTGKIRAKSFFVVCYLMTLGKEKFRDFVWRLKRLGMTQEEALKETYGFDFEALDRSWRKSFRKK